ncbi:MAG: ABC transporter substrate-binding protein [Candidatus Cryptobacteroides sp.]
MSTTHVGFLDAIGCDSVITGVSGLRYVCSPQLRKAAQEGRVKDVGYDAAPDYETILSLNPDLVLTYSVSGEMSRFENKLKSLGIRVFCINEHLERHPLARASYLRLFGALTGRMAEADSVLAQVRGNYERIRSGSVGRASHLHVSQEVAQTPARPSRHAQGRARNVLVNIPYSDQWFIPGGDNYMTHLIEDAGGIVLGAGEGERQSSVISLEKAYALASEADCWLNVGPCTTLSQLEKENPVFPDMLRMIETNAESAGLGTGALVWNCNLRQNSSGGNDFWETGAVRPDLILSDLVSIFNGDDGEKVFYRPLK